MDQNALHTWRSCVWSPAACVHHMFGSLVRRRSRQLRPHASVRVITVSWLRCIIPSKWVSGDESCPLEIHLIQFSRWWITTLILFNLVRTFVAVKITGEESHCFSLIQGIGCVSMISCQTLFIIILIEFHCFSFNCFTKYTKLLSCQGLYERTESLSCHYGRIEGTASSTSQLA